MKLETTPEKILEAAKTCPEAKKTLETLFPEVFKEKNFIIPKYSINSGLCFNTFESKYISDKRIVDAGCPIFIAAGIAPLEYKNKCFALSNLYHWDITKNLNHTILIPSLK